MSLTLASATTPTVFFICTTPGVFCLSLEGPGELYRNGTEVLATLGPVSSLVVFLTTDDTLSYTGPGASITGFRNGNEFDD